MRVGFAPGDRLYWSGDAGEIMRCKARATDYPARIAELCRRVSPTDLVMLGDGRFYHRVVAGLARRGEIAADLHVVEHGLIRPGLILVEPDGMASQSRIRDRFSAEELATETPDLDRPSAGSFAEYAALDVGYHVANMIAGAFYNPNYVRHSLDSPLREYSGWALKAVTRPARGFLRRRAERRISAHGGPRFLFPLQLATDFQVRDHGCAEPMEETLRRIVSSFAEHAPQSAILVVKRHPLDNGWTPWRKLVDRYAAQKGVSGRVEYVDGGGLDALLAKARGVVTINSTVGLTAILGGIPCCVLGTAVYDVPGLTDPSGLDAFWSAPRPPDRDTARRFERFLLAHYHVPGAFDGPGSKIGAENLADRICGSVQA